MLAKIYWDGNNEHLADVPSISHVPRVGEEMKLYTKTVLVGKVTRVEYTFRNEGANENVMYDKRTVDHVCGLCEEKDVAEAAVRLKELRDGKPYQALTLCLGCVGYVLREKFKDQFKPDATS